MDLPPPIPSGNARPEEFRTHGFEFPLRRRQILAVILYAATAPLALAALAPMQLHGAARGLFLSAFVASWLTLGVAAAHSMRCNPADGAVGVASLRGIAEEGKPFCAVCQVTVRMDSKHCWECNKCVANFDHHCPWLNNCIGAFNYVSFFISVCALLIMSAAVVAAAVAPLLGLRENDSEPLSGSRITICVVALVAYAPLWCLDLSLLVFHCYLCMEGITTYEHLTGKSRRPAPAKASGGAPSPGGRSTDGEGRVPRAERVASNRSFASSVSLAREVSGFMFGSSEVGEPSAEMVHRGTRHRQIARAGSGHLQGENEDVEAAPSQDIDSDGFSVGSLPRHGLKRRSPKSHQGAVIALQRSAARAAADEERSPSKTGLAPPFGVDLPSEPPTPSARGERSPNSGRVNLRVRAQPSDAGSQRLVAAAVSSPFSTSI